MLRGVGEAWHHVLRPAPAQTGECEALACFLMAPWCNRIAGGRFGFQGDAYGVRPNTRDATAIHGDVRERPFAILDRSPISVHLGLDKRSDAGRNWPWPFRATARYELDDATLTCELGVTNEGRKAMPAGVGFHPYWMRRLWDERDDVRIQANCSARYPLDGKIPMGPAINSPLCEKLRAGTPVGTQALDDVFSGSLDGATISWPRSGVRARFACSPELSHAVVYVPTNEHGGVLPWFCLEPVSVVNDGFNLMERGVAGTGVRVLGPGESLLAKWSVRFEWGAST